MMLRQRIMIDEGDGQKNQDCQMFHPFRSQKLQKFQML